MSFPKIEYTVHDMKESMDPIQDEVYLNIFLSTFQNVEGMPPPNADSKVAENILVEFDNSGKSVLKAIWKLPRGAVNIAIKDPAFASVILAAFLSKQEKCWRQKAEARFKCQGCKTGMAASVLFVAPRWGPYRNVLKVSVHFHCGKAACTKKCWEACQMECQFRCTRCFQPFEKKDLPPTAAGSNKIRFFCSKQCEGEELSEEDDEYDCREKLLLEIDPSCWDLAHAFAAADGAEGGECDQMFGESI